MKLSISLVILFFLLSCSLTDQYSPPDKIFINCGSSGTSKSNEHAWISDNDNSQKSFISLESQQSSSSVENHDQRGTVDEVPFWTSRISAKEFTYTFPVTQGPKFIRLYFFPTTYNETFDGIQSLFSVKAGSYTLLSNFSAWLHVQAEEQGSETLIKEFLVNVQDDQKLNLTFIPNNSSFAFINGIEVVSCPDFLYYTAQNDTFGLRQIGSHEIYRIENNRALEKVVRLNVGGREVPASNDTGMFRNWKPDDSYFDMSHTLTLPRNQTPLIFEKIPSYTAPEDVYSTARSMGTAGVINKSYNLTWVIPLDPSFFLYMVRLHFCEFYSEVINNHRVFIIYIDHQVVESQADVVNWAESISVPFYKDYAVLMGGQQGITTGKKINLTIELHPAKDSKTSHSDAILNGIELFKLSTNGSLAGPNPAGTFPSPPQKVPSQENTGKSKKWLVTAGLVTGGAMLMVVLTVGVFVALRRRLNARVENGGSTDGASKWTSPFKYFYAEGSSKTRDSVNSTLPSDLCHQFSLAEIKAATKNFDDVFIIGRGGFGNVYKGLIDDGATTVAIKRLKPESGQGIREFMTEIEMLSQLRHVHLVSLIGYCDDCGEMILVYDYMSRGTLRDHLYKTNNPPLPWKKRLEICISAAEGLNYLHTGTKHMIIHRDVKTTNILVDENWVGKVADFGLSKIGSTNVSKAYVSTTVKGTVGYLDPEYFKSHQLTEKSDVYSFGVVLFEVLSARPPINPKLDKVQVNLPNWARQCYSNGTLDQIVDPHIKSEITLSCLNKFGDIALSCLNDNGTQRPSMNEVVWGLKFALQLQESGIKDLSIYQGAPPSLAGSYEGFTSSGGATRTTIGEDVSYTNHSEILLSQVSVFSEIANPRER